MTGCSHGARVLSRARTLMANKGYGWSKALALAAETIDPIEAETGLTIAQQHDRARAAQTFYARIAALMALTGCSAALAHRAIEQSEHREES